MKNSIIARAVAGAMAIKLEPFRCGEAESRPFWGGNPSVSSFDNSAEGRHLRNGGEPWRHSGKRKLGRAK